MNVHVFLIFRKAMKQQKEEVVLEIVHEDCVEEPSVNVVQQLAVPHQSRGLCPPTSPMVARSSCSDGSMPEPPGPTPGVTLSEPIPGNPSTSKSSRFVWSSNVSENVQKKNILLGSFRSF